MPVSKQGRHDIEGQPCSCACLEWLQHACVPHKLNSVWGQYSREDVKSILRSGTTSGNISTAAQSSSCYSVCMAGIGYSKDIGYIARIYRWQTKSRSTAEEPSSCHCHAAKANKFMHSWQSPRCRLCSRCINPPVHDVSVCSAGRNRSKISCMQSSALCCGLLRCR